MVRRARVPSLAKVNLDLRVLNKRPGGFHELRTVFQTISLADTIEIEFEQARRRDVAIEDALGIPDNLIVRAAHAMLGEMRIAARVRLRLEKKIPMGGGLGGGSSNAAAVILALPVLAGRHVPLGRMLSMADALGSDVPFFLEGGTQIGLSRGEELYRLPDVRGSSVLLVSPGIHVATGPAYAALNRSLTFTESSISINSFQAFVRALGDGRSAEAASAFSANDFESVVFRQHPQLRKIAQGLRRFSGSVRMSGSGATIFALFNSALELRRAVEGLSGDRVFRGCRFIEAELVTRRGYQRLWRRQLREHLVPLREDSWPPRSRYAQ